MCFHLVDLPICMVPVLLGTEALDPLHHDSSVPGAVKDRDVSCLRHMIPEAPEIVMGFFHIVRRCCRTDLISAGIKMARQTFDRSSLSGGIPALKAKDHRDPQTVEFSVEHFQPFLELVQFFPVFRLLKTLCQVRFCKDPFFISVRRNRFLKDLRLFSRPFFLKCLFQNICHRLYDHQSRPALFLRVDHIPGRIRHIRSPDHLIAELFIFSVMGISRKFFLCDAPCGIL